VRSKVRTTQPMHSSEVGASRGCQRGYAALLRTSPIASPVPRSAAGYRLFPAQALGPGPVGEPYSISPARSGLYPFRYNAATIYTIANTGAGTSRTRVAGSPQRPSGLHVAGQILPASARCRSSSARVSDSDNHPGGAADAGREPDSVVAIEASMAFASRNRKESPKSTWPIMELAYSLFGMQSLSDTKSYANYVVIMIDGNIGLG
jgi:hypothetical protein